ncbi:altronate hydrolase [Spirochaetia bacterium]|nr:altronate hydrolase [Spirochaetia bacterium]
MQALIRIHPNDNAAVAVRAFQKGEIDDPLKITAVQDIPAGHKIALTTITPGQPIIKYGVPVGAATELIPAGSHVHTHNMKTMLTGDSVYHCPESFPQYRITGEVPEISAYRRNDGNIGIRNEMWIIPTVGCVNHLAQTLATWGQEHLPGDGVFAWTHPYGCSQMGEDHAATATLLGDLVKHPNAGGILVLSLGCENNSPEYFKKVLGPYAEDSSRIAFLTAQDSEDEVADGKRLLMQLERNVQRAVRQKVPASELIIGMKCGGSDGFSGITANPLIGRISDLFTGCGASVLLTEVPEIFGAEQILLNRCENRPVFDKTVECIEDFKNYYRNHHQVVYENPSPGNKAGGITTLEEKSCGCVQKGGSAIIRGVYRYGERVQPEDKRGLLLLEGPGNDLVSTTALTAAGAHLILFSTGRGTPLGAPVPTIKIATNSALAQKKTKWIDFDAGRLLNEKPESVTADLFAYIMEVVAGNQTKNEKNGYREIAVFKNGVTL